MSVQLLVKVFNSPFPGYLESINIFNIQFFFIQIEFDPRQKIIIITLT